METFANAEAKNVTVNEVREIADLIAEYEGCLLYTSEQQLHIDITSLPDSTLVFKDKERKDTLPLSSNDLKRKLQLSRCV